MPKFRCSICEKYYEDGKPVFLKAHPFFCSLPCLINFLRFKEVPPVEHERRNGHKPSFKSPYEERFSYFLKAAHIPYEHETRVVLLREELIYVPDFYLPNTGLFIELKGRLGPRGKKKISAFLDEHPDSLLYLDKQSLRRFHLI